MQYQRVRLFAAPGPQRPRDCGRDAAAHGSGGNHLHQHDHGKYQRHAGQRIGAEMRDPPGFDQARRRLGEHDQDIGPSKTQQRRHDGSAQHLASARIDFSRSRRRYISFGDGSGDYYGLAFCCGNHDALRFLPRAGLDDCCAANCFC